MKTNLHNILGADPILLEDGVWVDICPGIRVKIASSESQRFKSSMLLEIRERESHRTDQGFPDEVLAEATVEAVVKGLLLDWEGLTDDQGEPVPYTIESARELLKDPCLRTFYDRLAAEAQDLANFRRE